MGITKNNNLKNNNMTIRQKKDMKFSNTKLSVADIERSAVGSIEIITSLLLKSTYIR